MAESYKDISGIIICSVQARVKPGKADGLARLIALEQARANSDTEPGTLSFDAARFGDKFVFWAKFRSGEAMETHLQNQSLSYQEFVGQCLIEEPTVLFFPADSISPPEPQQ